MWDFGEVCARDEGGLPGGPQDVRVDEERAESGEDHTLLLFVIRKLGKRKPNYWTFSNTI